MNLLSHAWAAKARRELPPLFPIHSQIPGLPEAHAIQVPILSCSAQVVLGRPRGRFQSGPGALPQRAPIAVQSASWAGIPGCMRATCPKRASLLRLTLGSMSSRRVRSFTSKFVMWSNQRIPRIRCKLRMWKACRRLTSVLSRVHVSAQHNSTNRTHDS